MPGKDEIYENKNRGAESDLILKYLSQNQEDVNSEFSKVLVSLFPNQAPDLLLKQLGEGDNAKTDKLIKMLSPLDPPGFKSLLWPIMEKADSHLYSTILEVIGEPKNRHVQLMLENALNSSNPRILTTAIKGVICNEYSGLAEKATSKWKSLLESRQLSDQLAALDIMRFVHSVPYEAEQLVRDYRLIILSLLQRENDRVKRRALESLQSWPEQSFMEIAPDLKKLFVTGDVNLRLLCVNSSYLLSRPDYQAITSSALNDANSHVREAAVKLIFRREENSIELLTGWLTNLNKGSFRAQQGMIDILYENKIPAGIMAKVIMWKTGQLEETQDALSYISSVDTSKDSALEVLRYTLLEKRDQLMDLVLGALRSIESPDIIAVVRSGVHSKDSRYISQAVEVLRDMKNKHVATVLGDILENMDHRTKYRRVQKAIEFSSIESLLTWCQRQSDPWLQSCATQIRQQAVVLA